MSEWKPGDVAMVLNRRSASPDGCVSVLNDKGYWVCRHSTSPTSEIESIRPLVVIDAESAEQVGRLADAYKSVDHRIGHFPLRDALREFARPSRPEPPAFPALVADGDNEYWALHANGMWACVHSNPSVDLPRTWDTLCDDYGPIRVIFHGPADGEATS